MSTRVRMCIDRLRGIDIMLDDYAGTTEEAATDMLTADSVITNIAQKLLSEGALPQPLKDVLGVPLLVDQNHWKMSERESFDLRTNDILKEYARQIERLRVACEEAAG